MTTLVPPYSAGVYGLALYAGSPAMAVAITSPAAGATVETPGFTVTWQRTYLAGSGAQNDFRLRIYDTDQVTVLYDSGTTASASEACAVPEDWPAVEGESLYLRVNVTDEHGYTGDSGLHLFETAWTTPPPITGLTVTPDATGLPHLRLDWTAADATGFTFQELRVYRRMQAHTDEFDRALPAGLWVRIARPTDAAAVLYRDYTAGAGISYEYAVTQRGTSGGVTVESPKQVPPVSGTVAWTGTFLHDPAEAAIFTAVRARQADVGQGQQQATIRARGRREDTVFVGEGFSRSFDLALVSAQIHDRAPYQRLRTMLDRQFAGATYCLRIATSGEVVFGRLAPIGRTDRTVLTTPAMRFVETAYREAV
ncbi:MAG: hypothetical protein EPO65_08965 [Dehalococcoidia bacterium]|nr:MAG: hypothetical protein EPO65_08965 [Dehalococcoidia bacterium]